MSITNFAATIWSARIQANLDKNLVAMNLVNRDYESEAQSGSVKISQLGDVAVSTHARNGTVTYGQPASIQRTLTLNQRRIAGFTVDDLDAVQANINVVERYAGRLGYALAEEIDNAIFSQYTTAGMGDVAIDITTVSAGEVRNAFAAMGANVMKENLPGRKWVALRPNVLAAMMQDTTITQATERGDDILARGAIGQFMGFDLYPSNSINGTGVTVTLDGAVAVGDTSVDVDALSAAVPAGTILRFGGGKFLRVTANAASSATSITVAAATVVIADNSTATYIKVSKNLYGTDDAITFAMNVMPTVEALRDKDTTDDYVRAETNFGYLTQEPYALGTFSVTEIA